MILTVGDSVCWGQGLKEEHKFDAILANKKGLPLTRLAHSGAVIGTAKDSLAMVQDGEIPLSLPSIWQQVQSQSDWSQVQIVLLDGGINDIGLTRILNPLTTTNHLTQLVDQFCNQAVQELLEAAGSKLVRQDARIAVTGYFPILSLQSGHTEIQLRALLELHGIATTAPSVFAGGFSPQNLSSGLVQNCLTFWNHSNDALQAAVNGANRTLGRNVCVFVKLPFTEDNALWASHPLLWELTTLLEPEDEVFGPRGQVCEVLYGDLAHVFQLIQCDRASVGHPNVEGAAKIADALSATL